VRGKNTNKNLSPFTVKQTPLTMSNLS